MPLPNGYSVRAATREDAGPITDMFIEQEVVLNGEPESTAEDLYDDWATPGFDIDRDTWVILADGELVAYAGIVKNIPPDIYASYGAVHPAHSGKGLGTYLFEAVELRAVEMGGGRARVRQWVDAKDRAATEILTGRGYSFVRRFWRMDISLDEEVPVVPDPEGVTIRPFAAGRDERVAHAVLEQAFTEHWGYTPKTYEEAAPARWEAEWFRPDLSLVVEATGEMVGVCINGPRFEDGYVEDVGVLPSFRGRGIATALLRRSFLLFKETGMKRACLNVDSDNVTGAMRLYEGVGMAPGTSYDVYEVLLS